MAALPHTPFAGTGAVPEGLRHPLRVVPFLLALSLAVPLAGLLGCGGTSGQNRSGHPDALVRYSATPQAAAAVFSIIKTPAGFVRTYPCQQLTGSGYTACLRRRPSVVLSNDVFVRLVRESRLVLEPSSVQCVGRGHFTPPRLQSLGCHGLADFHGFHFAVSAQSLVVAGPRSFVGSSRGRPLAPPRYARHYY
jgi:hypothetical protein